MVYRKLDKISREMGAAANEDLWFRKMGGVRACTSGFRKGGGRIGCSGRVANDGKEKRIWSRTSMTLSVMSFPLPKA